MAKSSSPAGGIEKQMAGTGIPTIANINHHHHVYNAPDIQSQYLSRVFGIPAQRAHLIAGLAWEMTHV